MPRGYRMGRGPGNGAVLGPEKGMRSAPMRTFECCECSNGWNVPYGTGRPSACPRCGSVKIHRSDEGRGPRGGAKCWHAGRGPRGR